MKVCIVGAGGDSIAGGLPAATATAVVPFAENGVMLLLTLLLLFEAG